ncbi:hypothetical protein CFK38_04740 [Brachybacterium vulturis]|uniref:HPt domain-containing protein n=1 Tax=Brachybacterium vulturis TaxID=2017484 RepID=A0A291GLH5_9MICO|nr:hypothetical protein [Brachybacterium vulturis]ATG50912.1 hypothetical protein CFK38_04740 [Brachybacterium vulturis]
MPTAPVLDHDALRGLGEQLESSEILCGFLRRYLALLDQRLGRLERSLACADQEGWMDAVLSLKTSSTMAGAQALAQEADDLQRESVRCPSWSAPVGSPPSRSLTAATVPDGPALTRRVQRMAQLRALAAETARQLQNFLQQRDGAPSS